MPKRCLRTECMQPNPQHDSQFRRSAISGIKNKICRNCEADIEETDKRTRGHIVTRFNWMTIEDWRAKNGA